MGVKTDLMGMTPDIEFTRPDTLWDMKCVEKQSDNVGDDTKTEWGYLVRSNLKVCLITRA